MRSIPERFPPLEERIGQWGKQRILDELANPVTDERDRVLTLALLNRDVSEDELLAVLKSRWRSENGALLRTMVKEHQDASLFRPDSRIPSRIRWDQREA